MSTEHDSIIGMADILIVDDESANLKLLSEILAREGYHVRPANNPRLGIDSALGKPPDLILLDIRMPGMDGFEVCTFLKQDERTCDIPILFISALQNVEDKIRGFEAGGVDFITKPFQEEEVLARVRTHLKLHNMQQNMEELVAKRTAALTKSEQLARVLLNATTDLSHLIDEDGIILDLNDAMAVALGGTREELIGTDVFDFFPTETAASRREIARQALAGGKPIRHKDRFDSDLVYDTGIYPIKTPSGEKDQIVVFAHDITEREKYERQLQEREEWLNEAQRIAKLGNWSWDPNSREFLWSKNLYEMIGFNPENPAPSFEEHASFYAPESWTELNQVIDQTLKEGGGYDLEVSVIRTDGRPMTCVVRGEAVKDGDGQIIMLQGTIQDITRRKQAEQELEKSRDYFEHLLHSIPDAVFSIRLPDRIIDWALDSYGVLGRSPDEYIGKTTSSIYSTEAEYVRIGNLLKSAVKEKQDGFIAETMVQTEYGESIPAEISTTIYRDKGIAKEAILLVRDISERKKMEQALKENEKRLRRAQELARLGYWEWDLVTGRLSWSDEMYRIYGIAPGSPVTFAYLAGFVHPDDQAYRRELLENLLNGETIPSFNYRIVQPNGSTRYIYGMKLLDVDDNGEPCRLRGILQDVTEIKTVKMAYQDSETRLKKAQAETMNLRLEMAHLNRIMTMNELAASFAHEINQPLGAIANNASTARILYSQAVDKIDDFDEILADIGADAHRAGQIIRKIRGVMKKGDVVYTSVDVNQLMDDVLALYQNSFSLDHVSVFIEKSPDLVTIKGDPVRLQQVLVNLISNAMDAMEDSPQKSLTFETDQSGGTVKVSVKDTGPGIGEKDIDHIFDPFYSTKGEGIGIGLRICKSIIEEHGGRIWAENNPDAGTTFYFTLKAFWGE